MSTEGGGIQPHHEGMLPIVDSVDVSKRDDLDKLHGGAVGLWGVLFLTVTGSALYDDGGIREAVSLLADGQVPVDLLLEPGTISLHDVADACAKLASGQLAGKVMVVPS